MRTAKKALKQDVEIVRTRKSDRLVDFGSALGKTLLGTLRRRWYIVLVVGALLSRGHIHNVVEAFKTRHWVSQSLAQGGLSPSEAATLNSYQTALAGEVVKSVIMLLGMVALTLVLAWVVDRVLLARKAKKEKAQTTSTKASQGLFEKISEISEQSDERRESAARDELQRKFGHLDEHCDCDFILIREIKPVAPRAPWDIVFRDGEIRYLEVPNSFLEQHKKSLTISWLKAALHRGGAPHIWLHPQRGYDCFEADGEEGVIRLRLPSPKDRKRRPQSQQAPESSQDGAEETFADVAN